jgi:hypothetical protein
MGHTLLMTKATPHMLGPRHQIGVSLRPIGDEHLGHFFALAPLPAHPATGPLSARRHKGCQHRQLGGHIPDDTPLVPTPADPEPLLVHINHLGFHSLPHPLGDDGVQGQRQT